MKRRLRRLYIGLGIAGVVSAAVGGAAWWWRFRSVQSLPIRKLALTPAILRPTVIRIAQRQLLALGYPLQPTGAMDDATRRALAAFSEQRADAIQAQLRAANDPTEQAILTVLDRAYRSRLGR